MAGKSGAGAASGTFAAYCGILPLVTDFCPGGGRGEEDGGKGCWCRFCDFYLSQNFMVFKNRIGTEAFFEKHFGAFWGILGHFAILGFLFSRRLIRFNI